MASDISLDEKIDRFVDAITRLAKHPYLLGYVMSEAARHPDFVDAFFGPKELRNFMKRRRAELPAFLKRTL